MNCTKLLEELKQLTEQNKADALTLQTLSKEQLTAKKNSDSWNALECIEHLNRYGAFYIPEINKRLNKAQPNPTQFFKPGILGDYFAKSMLPKEKLNAMKTFKSMNPIHSKLDLEEMNTFINQQNDILKILDKSLNYNLTKIKTAITISPFIKLRLGDTLRVVIYHNWRHIIQAKKASS